MSAEKQGGDQERQEWTAVVTGAECFRKNNFRVFGALRLLRFKIGKDKNCPLPFHARETPLWSFRAGRVALALVRQNGELEAGQVPIVSDRNALARVKIALRRAANAPRLLIAGLFIRPRKYEHFLLMGYNCEMAFRFIRANGFLDSTFFAWAGGPGCEKMLRALDRFDELFTGDMTLKTGTRDVFADKATGVLMHSHYNAGAFNPGESDLEAVKAEIRSRAAYLREKFYRQLRDEEPTLCVLKMKRVDTTKGDEYARRYIEWLRSRGGRNFEFLVVCHRDDAANFPAEHPDYHLRTVASYNPDWSAVTEQFGDMYGWNLIWKEFAPTRVLGTKRKFGFEGGGGGK